VFYDYPMIGLYMGRFQPFHKGHLHLIKEALKEVKKLIIVVAVPLRKTEKDPFSAEERKKMVELALKEEGLLNKVVIYTLSDIPSDSEYVGHVRLHVPGFNVVFVGDNSLNQKLFSEAKFTVKTCARYKGINSTDIRQMMRTRKGWEGMVPKSVADYIKKNNLVKKVI